MTTLKTPVTIVMTVGMMFLFTTEIRAQRQMENLGRGVVAVNQGGGKVFVSWRLLGTEPPDLAFNVYRSTDGGTPVKLNALPLTGPTHFSDEKVDLSKSNAYFIRAIAGGFLGIRREQAASAPFTLKANAPAQPYLSITLKQGLPPNDASVGDLDGDGEYEIVLKREQNGRDNSQAGITGETHLEAYKLDGTFLWRINLGKNIRSGAHYTQFMVYDLDGDGKAEVACKTADGTVDGAGKVIGDPNADWRVPEGTTITVMARGGGGGRGTNAAAGTQPQQAQPPQPQQRSIAGHVLSGPEYLTIFDGRTGAALATTDYNPPRHPTNLKPTTEELAAIWGDGTGNRSDRYLACVAYLDGKLPSLIMCRGYYTRSTLAAWNWRGGKLSQVWFFDSDKIGPPDRTNPYRGQGNHGICVADVDEDGKDEIIYGAMCVDDNGKPLYSTRLGHGDAIHVSDLDPSRPGLEIWGIHENESGREMAGTTFRNARTGEIYFQGDWMADVGRGLAADVDPRYPGAELFGGGQGPKTVKGEKIQVQAGNNFAIWWDGDLLREILNANQISKWNWQNNTTTRLLTAEGCTSNNGTKSTPTLSADILGDWREEVIFRTTDNKELRIYTTTIPTDHRLYTLMHDPQYREAIAWQNVAYNQPPWPSFFIGQDMKAPPRPKIVVTHR